MDLYKYKHNHLGTLQVSMGPGAKICLEDKDSAAKVYAVCPIETYPGLAIQSVADSSRLITHCHQLYQHYQHNQHKQLYQPNYCQFSTFKFTISRYFVIRVTEGGKVAHLGLGFADRADSFDVTTYCSYLNHNVSCSYFGPKLSCCYYDTALLLLLLWSHASPDSTTAPVPTAV